MLGLERRCLAQGPRLAQQEIGQGVATLAAVEAEASAGGAVVAIEEAVAVVVGAPFQMMRAVHPGGVVGNSVGVGQALAVAPRRENEAACHTQRGQSGGTSGVDEVCCTKIHQ